MRRELPGWVSPIDAQRKQEVVTCARSVIDALWPALKDAYMHEVLESCVRRYDAMQLASTTPYVCVQAAPIRDGFDRRSARKGRLQPGETIDAASLAKLGVIRDTKLPLKVLGEGDLTKKLEVKAVKFSASARQKIEAAGGTVIEG